MRGNAGRSRALEDSSATGNRTAAVAAKGGRNGRWILDRAAGTLESWPRWVSFPVVFAVYYITYFFPNASNRLGWRPQAPLTFIDGAVPFIDWTVVVYLSVIPQIIIGLVWIMGKGWGRAMISGFVLFGIHFVFFMLYPLELPRSALRPATQWAWVFDIVWAVDQPRACFPSLHVAVALLVSFIMGRRSLAGGLVLFAWASVVAVSTLTTKQHYFLDVAGGAGTALIAYLAVFREAPFHAAARAAPGGRGPVFPLNGAGA
jgi:membrane-associated phospholipid phosphatase